MKITWKRVGIAGLAPAVVLGGTGLALGWPTQPASTISATDPGYVDSAPAQPYQATANDIVVDSTTWNKIPSEITANLAACPNNGNQALISGMAGNGRFDLDFLHPCLHDVYEFTLKGGQFYTVHAANGARMSFVTETNEDSGAQFHTFSCYAGEGNTVFMIVMRDDTLGDPWSWWNTDGRFDLDATHTYHFKVAVYNANQLDTATSDTSLDWAALAYEASQQPN